jgi:hypothetical protein
MDSGILVATVFMAINYFLNNYSSKKDWPVNYLDYHFEQFFQTAVHTHAYTNLKHGKYAALPILEESQTLIYAVKLCKLALLLPGQDPTKAHLTLEV